MWALDSSHSRKPRRLFVFTGLDTQCLHRLPPFLTTTGCQRKKRSASSSLPLKPLRSEDNCSMTSVSSHSTSSMTILIAEYELLLINPIYHTAQPPRKTPPYRHKHPSIPLLPASTAPLTISNTRTTRLRSTVQDRRNN